MDFFYLFNKIEVIGLEMDLHTDFNLNDFSITRNSPKGKLPMFTNEFEGLPSIPH